MKLKNLLQISITLGLSLSASTSNAQSRISDDVVKIGVLTDVSSLYSDPNGKGTITAANMAIKDFGGKVNGKPVELIYLDHQNKTDLAATTARRWFDNEKVDAIFGLGNTSIHFAVASVAENKNRILINTEAASSAITGEKCSPVVVHYTYDTYAVANGSAKTIVERGGKSWYFIAADYTFGQALTKDATEFVTQSGGEVLGTIKHPLNTPDFSSFVITALGSKAQVVGIASAAGDTINAIKAAKQFGLFEKKQIAALLLFITDVHALGLETAQGLTTTTGFYWDLNEDTRRWSKQFFKEMGRMPTMQHAGTYSAVTTYLKAIQNAGTDETAAVMAEMKKTPINDFFAKGGKIREDGRMVHDMYQVQVKAPHESKYPWDYYKVITTIPGDIAFRPLNKGNCPLVKG